MLPSLSSTEEDTGNMYMILLSTHSMHADNGNDSCPIENACIIFGASNDLMYITLYYVGWGFGNAINALAFSFQPLSLTLAWTLYANTLYITWYNKLS